MHPTERAQVVVVGGLHAQADAVDAVRSEDGEAFGVGAAGIGFAGPFITVGQMYMGAQSNQQPFEQGWREQGRSATADEQRVVGATGQTPDFAQQRVNVGGVFVMPSGDRVEVAVGALGGAIRDVEIEMQAFTRTGG